MKHIEGKIMDVPISTVMEWMNEHIHKVAIIGQRRFKAEQKDTKESS